MLRQKWYTTENFQRQLRKGTGTDKLSRLNIFCWPDLLAEDGEGGKVEAEGLNDDGLVQVPQLQHGVLHHGEISAPPLFVYGLGLTRDSLFEILREKRDSLFRPQILARYSRDSRVKISSETRRLKFRSKTRVKQVSLRTFVAGIASYESRRKKFQSKTRFSRVLQTNFVARLASLANRND
jgi:hypothetical protein